MDRFEPDDLGADLLDTALKNDLVERSDLERVIAIGKAFGSPLDLLELIALALRAEGAVLYWRATIPADDPFDLPQFSVIDDLGTEYYVRVVRWDATDGLGRGEAVVVPPPDRQASWVRIEASRPSRSIGTSDDVHVAMVALR